MRRSFFVCNVGCFLLGFTALFAKLIDWPAVIIVAGRASIAAVSIFCFMLLTRQSMTIRSVRDLGVMIMLGLLLLGHWVTYFYSVQYSTVAIGLISLFTFPVLTILIEPLFSDKKLDSFDVLSGVGLLIGVALIVPRFELDNHVFIGVLLGLVSAVFYAFRNIFSRRYVQEYSGSMVMMVQAGVAGIGLIPFLWVIPVSPTSLDWGYLFLLGVVFTGLAHTLFISSLRDLRAGTAGIIGSVQPVYGAILAYFILGEVPSLRTLVGGVLILGIVIAEIWKHRASGRSG